MAVAQSSAPSSALYSDFQNLAALRADARNTPSDAVGEVATHFESLFMQMMLKSMRDATVEGGLFDSNQMEVYQSMFDQQISLDLSRQGTLGLKDTLVEQLGGNQPLVREDKAPKPIVEFNGVSSNARRQVLDMIPAAGVPVVEDVASTMGTSQQDKPQSVEGQSADWLPSTPEEFIRDVWDHAVAAAKELGLDPRVLVAQSALETGWGKKVIRSTDGSNSFNLFGIKANHSWSGDAATVNTVEFRDGLAAMEKAAFRVYDSIASSFSDYVDFLKSNPRYQQALEKTADNREFLGELQNAGYATDPQYAEKIMGILDRNSLGTLAGDLVNGLKNFSGLSI